MKSAALVVLISVVLCNALEIDELCLGDNLMAVREKCIAEVGSSEEDLQEFRHQLKPSTDKGKCLRACVLQECNGLDPEGHINPTIHKRYLKLLTEDAEKQMFMDEIYTKCAAEVKHNGDLCHTAEEYYDCLITCDKCGWDWTIL